MLWFRKLPPRLKCAWDYILDMCDEGGIWSEDYDLASFQIGETITKEDIELLFGGGLIRVAEDKVFIPAFLTFQYGERLSPECKPHLAAIRVLKQYGIDHEKIENFKGYAKGMDTLKDKDKNKDQEKNKDKDQDKGPDSDFDYQKRRACQTWLETKRTFGITALGISPPEELEITKAIRAWGYHFTETSLLGYRVQERSDKFNPADFVRIGNVFKLKDGKLITDLYYNKGLKLREIEAKEKASQEVRAEKDQTEYVQDPEKVRAILNSMKSIPKGESR